MIRLLKLLANIPQDKLLHFFYGTLLSAPLVAFTSPLISSAIVIAIAFGKELYDKVSGKGNTEALDVVFTIAPVVIINIAKHI